MRRIRVVALAFALSALGCGDREGDARPQWLVQVETDALVPEMGDRLLVEILDADGELACASCRRESQAAEGWPFDYGIHQTDRDVYVRTRFYRGDRIGPGGQPIAGTTIDHVGRLPPLDGKVQRVRVRLYTSCIGVDVALPPTGGTQVSTCTGPERGRGDPEVLQAPDGVSLIPGATPLAAEARGPLSCHDAPAELVRDMACIDGGLFFLGNTRAPAPHGDVLAAAIPEQLVGVHTFLLDRREVSVRELREFMVGNGILDCPPGVRCARDDPASRERFCTYNPATAEQDDRAVNCVAWEVARRYCEANGKRLPREAEWEYAASQGTADTRFPWGNDLPVCGVANLATYDATAAGLTKDGECLGQADASVGVRPSIELEQDRAWDGVFALAGNVTEWTMDQFAPYGEGGCWDAGDAAMLVDPHCERTPDAGWVPMSIRGGSWLEPLQGAWSANRGSVLVNQAGNTVLAEPGLGFRCARSIDSASP